MRDVSAAEWNAAVDVARAVMRAVLHLEEEVAVVTTKGDISRLRRHLLEQDMEDSMRLHRR